MIRFISNTGMAALIVFAAFALVGPAFGQIDDMADIVIDGDLSEWAQYNPFHGGIDVDDRQWNNPKDMTPWHVDFWVLADANYLYFAGVNPDPNPRVKFINEDNAAVWDESDIEYWFDPTNSPFMGRPIDSYQVLFGPGGSHNDMVGNGGACIPIDDPWEGIGNDGAIWVDAWDSEVEYVTLDNNPGYRVESRVPIENFSIEGEPIDPNDLLGKMIGWNSTVMFQNDVDNTGVLNGRLPQGWSQPYDQEGGFNNDFRNPDGIRQNLGNSQCSFLWGEIAWDRIAIVGGTTAAVEAAGKLTTTWGEIKSK